MVLVDGVGGRWRWVASLNVGFGLPFIETSLGILRQTAIAAYSPEALSVRLSSFLPSQPQRVYLLFIFSYLHTFIFSYYHILKIC